MISVAFFFPFHSFVSFPPPPLRSLSEAVSHESLRKTAPLWPHLPKHRKTKGKREAEKKRKPNKLEDVFKDDVKTDLTKTLIRFLFFLLLVMLLLFFFFNLHINVVVQHFSKKCLSNQAHLWYFSFLFLSVDLGRTQHKDAFSFEGTFGKTWHGLHHIRLQLPHATIPLLVSCPPPSSHP